MIDTTIRPTLQHHAAQLWAYRELLATLVTRDIKAQTKQSLLGYVWIVGPPLFQVGLFTLIFQSILKLDMDTSVAYPAYIYTTTLPWQMFAGMLGATIGSVVGHGGLIKQVYFPREVVGLSAMAAVGFRTMIAAVPLVAVLILYDVPLGVNLMWVPLLVAIQTLLAFGIGLPLAAANAVARDVSRFAGLALTIWMYVTPVIYPLEKIPAEHRSLYMLNPMTIIIQGYRSAVLENTAPDVLPLLAVAGFSVVLFLFSYRIYKRAEGSFADII